MSPAPLSAALAIIALTAGAGYSFVGSAGAKLSLAETMGWSWGAGTLILAGAYTVMIAFGARPGPKKLGLVLAVVGPRRPT